MQSLCFGFCQLRNAARNVCDCAVMLFVPSWSPIRTLVPIWLPTGCIYYASLERTLMKRVAELLDVTPEYMAGQIVIAMNKLRTSAQNLNSVTNRFSNAGSF